MKPWSDDDAAHFIYRPRFWTHLWALASYPVRIARYFLAMRKIERMFAKQRLIALAPRIAVASNNAKLIHDTESDTRIQGDLLSR